MSQFLDYVRWRISANKNFLCVITGQTGSGKSYSALKLGEVLDPEFSINRVAFNSLEFMQIINKANLKKGSVVVFDEAGVGLSAREWQSVQNRLINYVLQTFRHKNFIVIFTTPHFGFIEAGSRKLFHCHMETVGINTNKKFCRIKPLMTQINQRKGKIYYKYLRVKTDRGLTPIKRINFPLPSKGLVKAYEDKKTAYTTKLNKDILAELESKADGRKHLTERQEEVVKLLKDGLIVEAVSHTLGISEKVVYDHINAIRKKGYSISPVKDESKVLYYEVDV